jgi:hypothetical protein
VADVDAARAAVAGFVVALLAAGVLLATGSMRGPNLWDGGHAILEVVPLAFAGSVVGYRFARCGVAVD